jgi:hypothetical protein
MAYLELKEKKRDLKYRVTINVCKKEFMKNIFKTKIEHPCRLGGVEEKILNPVLLIQISVIVGVPFWSKSTPLPELL